MFRKSSKSSPTKESVTLKAREMKRLERELDDIKSLAEGSSVDADIGANDNWLNWSGSIIGPESTPYEGGKFFIDIEIPADYPYTPPKMKFITKIWHPNISSQTGAICLDILGKEWSPALTIRTALLSILALLSTPEPDDPQDAEVAKMFKSDRGEFDRTAKYWTESFAPKNGSLGMSEEKISQIVDMGFTRDQATDALEKSDGDANAALNLLLGG